jgi:hypothetical protein
MTREKKAPAGVRLPGPVGEAVPRARRLPAGSILRIGRLKLICMRSANDKPGFY